MRGVNTHTRPPQRLLCLSAKRSGRPGRLGQARRGERLRLDADKITSSWDSGSQRRPLRCLDGGRGVDSSACRNREATRGWMKPDVYGLYGRMDARHPRRLQPIFAIYLAASGRRWRARPPRRLSVVFMCGPGLSRPVYIHGAAIWAAASLSAPAVSLAAVLLSAGRGQH